MADAGNDLVSKEEAAARDAYVMARCAVCNALATRAVMPRALAFIDGVLGFPACDDCARDIMSLQNPADRYHVLVALAAICALREVEYWERLEGGGYEQ